MQKLLSIIICSTIILTLSACNKDEVDEPVNADNPVIQEPLKNTDKFNEIVDKVTNHMSEGEARAKVLDKLEGYQDELNIYLDSIEPSSGDDNTTGSIKPDSIDFDVVVKIPELHKAESYCGTDNQLYVCIHDPDDYYAVFKVVEYEHYGDEIIEKESMKYANTEFIVNMSTGEIEERNFDKLVVPDTYEGTYSNETKSIKLEKTDAGYIFELTRGEDMLTGLITIGSYDQEFKFDSNGNEVIFKFDGSELLILSTEQDTMSAILIDKYTKE